MADVKGVNPPSVRDEALVSDPTFNEKHEQFGGIKRDGDSIHQSDQFDDGLETPTEEELETLRRVVGKIPWVAFTVGFAELCERFS